LITRILAAPDEQRSIGLLAEVNRLNQNSVRRCAPTFREAGIALIVKHVVPLRISDAEVVQLARACARHSKRTGCCGISLGDIRRTIAAETQRCRRSLVKARACMRSLDCDI
jgi:hypothetical protein